MLKRVFATRGPSLGAALVAAVCIASPGAARERNQDRSYDNDRYRAYRSYQGQRPDAPRRGVYDPNSYDGRRTGQPRTCGSDFMLYDSWGVPHGPYCN